LAGLVDDEGGALGFLLGDLLGLDGGGEFGGEGEVLAVSVGSCGEREAGVRAYCQRDVIEHDVEARGSPDEVVADESGDVLALGDELRGVELGDDALQDLVHDGRQHALVVVGAQGAVDLREGVDARPAQHSAGDVDHLQVLCARQAGDVPRLRAHVVGDGRLEPRHVEVGAFAVDFLLDAPEARVLDGAVASVDVEQGVVRQPEPAAEQHQACDAAGGAFRGAAARAAEARGAAGQLILDALPGFLGIGCGHCGV
jgi:hypothetical protein